MVRPDTQGQFAATPFHDTLYRAAYVRGYQMRNAAQLLESAPSMALRAFIALAWEEGYTDGRIHRKRV